MIASRAHAQRGLRVRAIPNPPSDPQRRASPRLRQDDAKDAHTTSKLLTAAPVEELLSLKREAEEAQRLKAGLSRVARSGMQDAWDLD
jgi:hypothetical protein